MTYVYFNNRLGKYVVQKCIDGKSHHFGTFTKRDDAEEFKEYCIANNWDFKCKLNSIGDNTPRKRVAHMFGLDVKDVPK